MIRFSDVYVNTVARGLCQGNEQFVSASAGSYQSFWTFNIPLFRHDYLFIATSERLVVVDHRKGFVFDRMDQVTGYRWSDIGSIKVGGVFTKKLVVKDHTNRTVVQAKLPKMLANMFGWPLKNNPAATQMLLQTWEQRRQLGAAPAAYGQLPGGQPQPQPYAQQPEAAQPQYAAPPAPQYAAPQSYAPPPQSYAPAPGYAQQPGTPSSMPPRPPPPPQRAQQPAQPPQQYAQNPQSYGRPS